MSPLDADEQSILASVEADEWRSAPDLIQEIERYQHYAQSQLSIETVSVELPASDVQILQILAQQADTSVSLLMASVLHQYAISQSSSQS